MNSERQKTSRVGFGRRARYDENADRNVLSRLAHNIKNAVRERLEGFKALSRVGGLEESVPSQ